jgi:hypothetical protein
MKYNKTATMVDNISILNNPKYLDNPREKIPKCSDKFQHFRALLSCINWIRKHLFAAVNTIAKQPLSSSITMLNHLT